VGKPRTGKALTNEVKYPYIVELAVRPHETNAELNGRIIDFHRSRKIQARRGRHCIKENKMYFRWCFSDWTTAGAFIEQFGGKVYKPAR
jgi:hypothetical protein